MSEKLAAATTAAFKTIAKTTLDMFDKTDRSTWRDGLALTFATVFTQGQNYLRRRVQVVEIPLPFNRKEVEFLANADAWMKIEAAKALGLAILENPSVCLISRKLEDTKVIFTVKAALVAKEDWNG